MHTGKIIHTQLNVYYIQMCIHLKNTLHLIKFFFKKKKKKKKKKKTFINTENNHL